MEDQLRCKELLAIGVDEDGTRHAIYPTASRTLCSLGDDGLEFVSGNDPGGGPDCLVCATTAAAFDRIDRSAPWSWFHESVAA